MVTDPGCGATRRGCPYGAWHDAAVLVAVAIGGAAAMSGIVKCWSTGAVNWSGKRHVCELFGCFGDSYGRSAVARLTLELTIANCAI